MPEALLAASIDVGDKIREFGGYAGLLAIIGLGVLTLLYFSQARELKRLRDWAGRAPERAADQEAAVAQAAAQRAAAARPAGAPQRMAAHPQAQGGATGTVAPRPVNPAAPGAAAPAAPAAPAAGAAGAAALTAAAQAGRPAGQPAAGQPGQTPGAQPPATPGQQPGTPAPGAQAPSAPAAPRPAGAPPEQPTTVSRPTPTPTPTPAPAPRPTPARPTAPLRAPLPETYQPRSQRTRGEAQETLGVKQRSTLKTTLLVVGGVIAVAAIVFVLVTQIFGGDDSAPTAPNTIAVTSSTTTKAKKKSSTSTTGAPAVSPAATSVAVLNGTGVTGLGAKVSAKVASGGFKTLTPGDAGDQSATTTTVYFAEGKRAAADEVARELGLPAASVRALDQNIRTAAGPANANADVIVVAGADQNTA